MSLISIAARILLSAFLGGVIGIERQIKGHSAGFRTHMLVCIGSALFMMVSIKMALQYSNMDTVDPTRIAAGVVTGIGFLGAGAVMRFKSFVYGLTTAASIWVVSAIGLAAGAGHFDLAVLTSGVVLAVLFLSHLEEHFDIKGGEKDIQK